MLMGAAAKLSSACVFDMVSVDGVWVLSVGRVVVRYKWKL